MPENTLRVYISSTFGDLNEHRQAVRDSILSTGDRPVVMEQFGASADPPTEVCRINIQSSDLMVLIIGHRYGWIPPGGNASITEFEFRAALEASVPILAFIVDDAYQWPPQLIDSGDMAARLKKFKEHLRSQLLVGYFTSPSDLAVRVVQALGAFRVKRGLQPAESAAFERRRTIGVGDELVIKIEDHLNSLRSQIAEIREQLDVTRSKAFTSGTSTSPALFLGAPAESSESDVCFVAMPYSKEWSNALEGTLLDICKSCGMKLLVAKYMEGRFIPNDIWRGITSATVIVADITDGNPNVAYEIGLADVLGKEVVLLCQGNKIPFDFSGQRLICYEDTIKGSIILREELTARLRRLRDKFAKRHGHEPVNS